MNTRDQTGDEWWHEHDKLAGEVDTVERRMRKLERALFVSCLVAALAFGMAAGIIMHLTGN